MKKSDPLIWVVLTGGLAGILIGWFFYRQPPPNEQPPTQMATLPIIETLAPTAIPIPTQLGIGDVVPLSKRRLPARGDFAPDFTLPALDGTTLTLSDLHGKVVLLNFWASWCPPCREEMPRLEALSNEYQEDGLVVLGINTTYIDSLRDAVSFVQELQITFPILLDETGEVGDNLYFVRSLPTSVWIDRDGIIGKIQIGAMDAETLKTAAKDLLER